MRDGMEKRLAERYGALEADDLVRGEVIGSLSAKRAKPRSPLVGALASVAFAIAAYFLVPLTLPLFDESPEPAGDGTVRRIAARFTTDGDPGPVMEVMRKRLDTLGVDGEVYSEEVPGGIELYLPPGSDKEVVSAALLRPGTLELRVVIEDPEEPGGRVFGWWDGKEPMRVRMDACGITAEDVDPAKVETHEIRHPGSGNWTVSFEILEDRQEALAEFSRANLNRRVALIIDGRIHAVPVIMSVLAGGFMVTGGGPSGVSKAEAESLAAALISGAYPSDVRPR